jgi:hypothetical protein
VGVGDCSIVMAFMEVTGGMKVGLSICRLGVVLREAKGLVIEVTVWVPRERSMGGVGAGFSSGMIVT